MRAARRGSIALAGVVLAGAVGGSLATAPVAAVPGGASAVWVNEFHYDNTGTDVGEFVEVAGPAGTDLSGWGIVRYNGSTPGAATVYSTPAEATALAGTIPDQQGGYGTVVVEYAVNGLQNGPSDGFALVDSGGVVVQLLSYEGTFTAADGPAAGLTSTDVGVSQPSDALTGSSLQLVGTGTVAGDFTWIATDGSNTKGEPNTGQSFAGTLPPTQLSEIRIDQPGTDNDEYLELSGEPGSSLDDLSLLVLGDGAGGSGVVENVVSLAGQSIGASGFFVVAESTFTLGSADLVVGTGGLNFENGDNVTHMLVRGSTATAGQDLDTNDDGSLDVTPWSEVVDRVALVRQENPPSTTEWHYGPPTVGPDGTFVPGHVLLCDGGWRIGAFDPVGGKDTPGAANACAEPPPPPTITLISAVQGSTVQSPLLGSEVTVQAVVTAVKPGLSGFYLQEEAADHDDVATTSEGIFVFGSATVDDVSEGQQVQVTGTVGEFTSGGGASSMTQLTSATVEVLGAGETITPAAVTFPVASTTELEQYEGMLVRLTDELVISEYFNYDRFGEVVLAKPLDGEDRLHTPTAVVEPGAPARALAAEQALRTITLDDSRSSQNPTTIPHPGNGADFGPTNSFRGGDTVTGVTGVIDDTFGRYRIQPTVYGTYGAENPRPATPPVVGGSITVASFNVLNYFLTIDEGQDTCGPSRDMDCRGADSEEEFGRQRAKTLQALAALDADVVGLIELENTPGVEPAADLAMGLNDLLGAGTYSFLDTGVIGTDAIRVGLLYKPGAVRPAGGFAILDSSVDQAFIDTLNRPMLTQTFDEVATGSRVTVSVNHLKSKGSACPGDPDTGDGQGNCNGVRTAAAGAIARFLATDPTGSGDPDQLVIGDLNSYDEEDPIRALEAAGYTDLVSRFGGERAYGYVFDGRVGYLDHALAGDPLAPQVTGTSEWHINADEPDILDYNLDFGRPPDLFSPDLFRSSDHDPVLVGLSLDPAVPGSCTSGDAQSVVSYQPGVRSNGTSVPPAFRDPSQALGLSDPDPDDPYWTTLGLGGNLVLAFARPVQNNNGTLADLVVVDAADGARGREDAARVLVSWDGSAWWDAGRVTGTGEVDLGPLPAVRYVQVLDDTTGRLLPATDGFDLDAVEVLTGCA